MTFPFTYRGNLDWLQSNTLFLAKSGSHAYGTALPTSDIDYRGIAIPPIRYFFGFLDRFEEAIQEKDPDFCIYHILKFVDLAADNNANVMEVLYLPDDCVEFRTLNIEPLFEVRDEFLSKRCRYSFSGYAFAQLKRIQTHRDWLLKPLTRPPERADVGLTDVEPVEKHKLDAMKAAIQKEIDSWSVDVSTLPLSQRTKMLGHVRDMLADRISISETEQAGRRLGFGDDVIAHLEKHRKLAKLQKNWEQFLQWKANRNPARAELEAVYGYDCYLDDTEFLTWRGWKRYDEITPDDYLGTLNQTTQQIEFQRYTERVAKPFDGEIGFLHPQHSQCAVTMNHRMLVSRCHRSAANGYSRAYVEEDSEWCLFQLKGLVESRYAHFHIRVTGKGHDVDGNIPDWRLILTGLYLSEGCVAKRITNGDASVIRISQKAGGRAAKYMEQLRQAQPEKCSYFEYLRDEDCRTEPCLETIITFADPEIVRGLEESCGSGSSYLRIPTDFFTGLSRRQARLLIDVMVSGDGSNRPKSDVYHTSSKMLADDVQTLCICNGITSQVWGPYQYEDDRCPMYQTYIGQERVAVPVRLAEESNSFHTEEVRNARIVCFTVPNEILITRRNGNVAIQGNTKHASHLLRLLQMCKEILEGKGVIVRRPNADELKAVRRGVYKLEEILEQANKTEEEIKGLYETSTLKREPNRRKINETVIEIVDRFLVER